MLPRKIYPLLTPILATLPLLGCAQTAGSGATQSNAAPTAAQQPCCAGETVYGSQLMTSQERSEYWNKMRAARTPEERERLRAEHHKEMAARAKERGVTLPDEPPSRGPRGPGMGQGMGPGMMGPGMGPGSGGGMGPRSGTTP